MINFPILGILLNYVIKPNEIQISMKSFFKAKVKCNMDTCLLHSIS